MRALAIIPARFDSKRFPGKVLHEVAGRPVIHWVYERVARAERLAEVWIATDSDEVDRACRSFTSHIFRSTAAHATGTDRVAEAARDLDADVIVNVQTDEPMIDPALVDGVIALFDDPAVELASAASPIHTTDELLDPDVVKVVCNAAGDALYFSRAAIPWNRDEPPRAGQPMPAGLRAYDHIGIYGYRKPLLLALAEAARSPLEELESLEQLRALHHGWPIRILEWSNRGVEIDRPEDVERLRAALERSGPC